MKYNVRVDVLVEYNIEVDAENKFEAEELVMDMHPEDIESEGSYIDTTVSAYAEELDDESDDELDFDDQ